MHAADLAQALVAVALGRAVGRRVRGVALSGAVVRAALGVAGAAARALGRAPLLDRDKANELLAPGWSCSSEALRRDAGWAAEIPLDHSLAQTARAYREAGWL